MARSTTSCGSRSASNHRGASRWCACRRAVSDAEHHDLGATAKRMGIRLVAVAAPEYGAEQDVDSIDDALALLADIGEGDAVLIKASRAAGLERLAQRLSGSGEW